MPVYLPPLSRREFLRRVTVAGGALAFGPQALAAQSVVPAQSWALLSDTHISKDRNRVERGANMTDNLRAVRREVLGLKHRPHGVLIDGDCAFHQGLAADYRLFTELLMPFRQAGLPLFLTLGNHDDRANFEAALPEARQPHPVVAGHYVGLLRTPLANWFLLDSLEAVNYTPGFLGKAQRAWLTRMLDANTDKPALIFGHHNPDRREHPSGLKDTEALFEILRPRRQVKAYIFGHTHHWEIRRDPSGLHLVNLPPTAYLFNRKDPNGWVQLELAADGARLELNCLDKKHPDQGQVVRLAWRS